MRKEFVVSREDENEEKRIGGLLPLNLQFFAGKAGDDDNNDDNNSDGNADVDDNSDADDNSDDNNDDSNKAVKSGKNKAVKSGKNGKTFSQDEVSKMMSKEKRQGRDAALRELGIDPKDKKAVEAVKAYIDSKKTDDERAAEKDTEVREANRRAQIAEAKAEAMTMGVKPQFVDDLITLVLSKKSDDSELDLKTTIGEFKTKYPVWFGKSEDDGDESDNENKTGRRGTGSTFKGKDKKGKGKDEGLGARLAAQRKSSSKKKSYWNN